LSSASDHAPERAESSDTKRVESPEARPEGHSKTSLEYRERYLPESWQPRNTSIAILALLPRRQYSCSSLHETHLVPTQRQQVCLRQSVQGHQQITTDNYRESKGHHLVGRCRG
jgi:hypothetical protein